MFNICGGVLQFWSVDQITHLPVVQYARLRRKIRCKKNHLQKNNIFVYYCPEFQALFFLIEFKRHAY